MTDARLEGIHLLLPGHGDQGPTLEIFSYADTEPAGLATANRYGFSHIAFEVDDVETTLDRTLSAGASLLGEVTDAVIASE